MTITLIIMSTLALIFSALAYRYGVHITGLKVGGDMLLQTIPLIVIAFLIAGMIQALVPREVVVRWIGKEAGIKGIFIGSLAGALAPGGPYVNFPIVAVLAKGGAGLGPLTAFVAAWGLLGVFRFVSYELPLLGPHIALARYASSIIFPPLVGLLAHLIFER